jgi:ribonuclease HII
VWHFEQELWQRGIRRIAGVDEAGRGPWAGPVVAAAVVVPPGFEFSCRIDDSKKLSPRQREAAFVRITQGCTCAYSIVAAEEIDRTNILAASLLAMTQALVQLQPAAEHALVDGRQLPRVDMPATAIIGGDARCISIACASIVAKVVRDRLMVEYDRQFPRYGFARHKGYGTAEHQAALCQYGPCVIHRKSFRPVKECVRS